MAYWRTTYFVSAPSSILKHKNGTCGPKREKKIQSCLHSFGVTLENEQWEGMNRNKLSSLHVPKKSSIFFCCLLACFGFWRAASGWTQTSIPAPTWWFRGRMKHWITSWDRWTMTLLLQRIILNCTKVIVHIKGFFKWHKWGQTGQASTYLYNFWVQCNRTKCSVPPNCCHQQYPSRCWHKVKSRVRSGMKYVQQAAC